MNCWSFLKGMLVGFITGILIAPKSGKETRREIKDIYGEITNGIARELSQLKEISRKTYDEVIDSVVTAYKEAKKITVDEAENIRDELKAGFERFKEAHDETERETQTP